MLLHLESPRPCLEVQPRSPARLVQGNSNTQGNSRKGRPSSDCRLAAGARTACGLPPIDRRAGEGQIRSKWVGGWMSPRLQGESADFPPLGQSSKPTRAVSRPRCPRTSPPPFSHGAATQPAHEARPRAHKPEPGSFSSCPITRAPHRRQARRRLLDPTPTAFPSP